MKVIGVLLQAAGLSKRMGKNKCLLPWQGQTVIETVADAFIDVQSVKVAVVGNAYNDMRSLLCPKGFLVVENLKPEAGQSSSLQLGIHTLLAECEKRGQVLAGVLCAVADQPFLTAKVVNQIIKEFSDRGLGVNQAGSDQTVKTIVCPIYGPDYKRGNPVLFGSYWLKEFLKLEGDRGGRSILMGAGAMYVEEVYFADARIREDIDTPEKYNELIHS